MNTTTFPVPSPGRNRTVILTLVLASYLMILLDISIVITGLPKMRADLGFSATGLSWVHTAYTLTFGGLLMAGARAGDLFGRKRMFITGLTIFVIASLLIGCATSPTMLVVARSLQGLGSAILAPTTLALLSVNFAEGPGRTRALGLYGATAGFGASIGMVLGGVLADLLSWRVGFFINVPIGLLLIWGANKYVKETPSAAGRLDLPGAVLSTLGMVSLVYGLVEAADAGWASPHSWLPLAASVLLLTTFIRHESRTVQPLLPLRVFADRSRNGAFIARMFFLAGMIGFWFYTTQYLQGVLGMRPLQAGLAFLPATVVQFFAAMSFAPLSRRFGNDRVLAAGLTISALGMAWLAGIGPDSDYLTHVALPMVVLGIGQGISLSPLTIAGVAGVPPADAGAASGVVNTAHQIGGSIGLALLVLVFAGSDGHATNHRADLAHRVAACMAMGSAFLWVALAVMLLCTFRRPVQSIPLASTAKL